MPARTGPVWKLYAALLGAATTVVSQRLISRGWRLATGDEPPDVGDPDTPLRTAIGWAVASGLGMVVGQLLVGRFAARRWRRGYSDPALRAARVTWSL